MVTNFKREYKARWRFGCHRVCLPAAYGWQVIDNNGYQWDWNQWLVGPVNWQMVALTGPTDFKHVSCHSASSSVEPCFLYLQISSDCTGTQLCRNN